MSKRILFVADIKLLSILVLVFETNFMFEKKVWNQNSAVIILFFYLFFYHTGITASVMLASFETLKFISIIYI